MENIPDNNLRPVRDAAVRPSTRLRLASIFLRTGLASVFLYASIAAFLNSLDWVAFFPPWVESIGPRETFLFIFSSLELVLGFWLLSGRKLFYAAALSAAILAGILLTGPNLLDVTFRDVGLFFSSLALMAISKDS